jgi:transposase
VSSGSADGLGRDGITPLPGQLPATIPDAGVPGVTVSGQGRQTHPPICHVANLLGISTAETLRKWVRQDEIDQGPRPGTTSEESAEIKRLKRENAELKRANVILKAASVFFAELDRPGL